MFGKSASYRHKNQVRVKITLAGQAPFEAFVFLKVEERLIDLLNDERAFIPVRRSDGATVITAKTNIVSIVEYDDPDAEERLAGMRDEADAEPIVRAAEESEEANEEEIPASVEEPVAEDVSPEPETREPGEDPAAEKQPATEKGRHRFDPYQMLRVAPDASLDDIRKAYKARIKAVHPDALAALDLDEDIERAANLTAQKVNRAYKHILRERKKSEEADERAEAAESAEKTESAA